jgi:hypothetical protein
MNVSTRIAHAYLFAKHYIISKGYANEIDWQDGIDIQEMTEEKFLHEISWVIIASGMNDKVVRIVFPKLKAIMYDFKSAKLIASNKRNCLNNALKVFNHRGKMEAIIYVATYIDRYSFKFVKSKINSEDEGINFIKTFPYMGDATSYHLAKNIGLEVAKPDRHLIRISNALGFKNPNDLCKDIATNIQERITLVDLVLWRYATLDKNYLKNLNWFIGHTSSTSIA